jgi:amino acid transporter
VATFAATGVIAVPLSFPLLAVALGLFAIGYTRLARDVPHAATFAALLTHGLGRTVGAAAAFVAVLAYNCVQIGLYGLLGATVAGQLGGTWWAWALVAWATVAVIGYRGVTLGAPVIAVVLALELGMIVLFDVVALTHPAHTDIGPWLQPWRPDMLAVDGVGGVLAFGIAAFLGFETTAAFGEEVRSERSVGRATWTCLAFLGIFYGISTWAMAVAVGPESIVDAARDPGSGIPFSVLATGLGPFGPLAASVGVTLLAGSVLGAMIALHQVVARYVYALGRERVVPRALAFVSSPHDNSVRAGRRRAPQRRRRGRTGGVPIGGSASQSALALTVIVAAGLLGLDPIGAVFTVLTTLSALGLLTVMTGTCVAVIAYYRLRDDRPAWWVWCGAPALGGLALAAALAVSVANLGPTLADPSGVAPFLLPLLVVAAALAGAQRARWLRRNDPAAWQRLGRGRPAPLALRDVVVADLEL